MKTLDSNALRRSKRKIDRAASQCEKICAERGRKILKIVILVSELISPDERKTRLYSENLRGSMKGFDAYAHHKKYFENCRDASPLNRLLYVDFKTFMPALNLDTTDKTSMAANLEVRVPFLNHELVSLSERIPAELKIKGLKRKYILKKAAESILPKEIIWRKKAGFRRADPLLAEDEFKANDRRFAFGRND